MMYSPRVSFQGLITAGSMAEAKETSQLQSGTVPPILHRLVASKVSYKDISKCFRIDITLFVLFIQILQYKERYVWHVNIPFLAVKADDLFMLL